MSAKTPSLKAEQIADLIEQRNYASFLRSWMIIEILSALRQRDNLPDWELKEIMRFCHETRRGRAFTEKDRFKKLRKARAAKSGKI